MNKKKISIVVPLFNEEESLPIFYDKVKTFEPFKNMDIEIVFVNDGSQDKTPFLLKELALKDPCLTFINFSRNFGKEAALMAGIEFAEGDAIIPMDVDLQDPLEVVPLLIEKWEEGFDVVLAKREDRSSDSFLKRITANLFYKFHNSIANPKIEENVGDFRLLSRRVVEVLKQMPERNLFMKGNLSWVGFPTTIVPYKREERSAGSTKFNGWKLWNLAVEGITSFSTIPLKVWTYLGFFIASFSFVYAIWLIIDKMIWDNPVAGYPSLMTAILFLGGVQLIGIGVMGEYIGRIYIETKQRPRYIIQDLIKNQKEQDKKE